MAGGTLVPPRRSTCSLATGTSRWWLPRDQMCDAYPAVPRYFKQIVKSARANGTARPTEDHTDDFLGCLNIPVWVSGCKGFTHGCFTSLEYYLACGYVIPQAFPILLELVWGDHAGGEMGGAAFWALWGPGTLECSLYVSCPCSVGGGSLCSLPSLTVSV